MQEALRKAMFHLAWSPDTLPTSQAVEPLFDYLHNHFLALNIALLPQNFQRVLFEVSKLYDIVLLTLFPSVVYNDSVFGKKVEITVS